MKEVFCMDCDKLVCYTGHAVNIYVFCVDCMEGKE